MEAARRLLQISAMHWLQACAAATIAAVVLHLVAHIVGALFFLVAVFAIFFAAAAFVKSMFSDTPRKTGGEGAE